MIRISIRADVAKLRRSLEDVAQRQVPFATAQALTATAKLVQKGQRELLQRELKVPTPFTLNSIRVKGARKNDLNAEVFVQDIAAGYLSPFILGGRHKLIGRGITWFNPKHVNLNQYGNLSAGTIRRLRARADVFVGAVMTKTGKVDGIWQRVQATKRGMKRSFGRRGSIAEAKGTLILIARFGDPIAVRQRIDWFGNARRIVSAEFPREFEKALRKAMASSR